MKTCDHCVLNRIAGMLTHEAGCPNEKAIWDREMKEWVQGTNCTECECFVPKGQVCTCFEMDEDEDSDDLPETEEYLYILELEEHAKQ